MRGKMTVFAALGLALLLGLTLKMAQAQELQQVPNPPVEKREFPPGTGFIPHNVDQSHLTGQQMPPQFKDYAPPPVSFDWRTLGKVTPVKNQGLCGACYAFGTMANIESKMLIDGAGTYDFSENHAKECNWYDPPCSTAGIPEYLVNLFSQTGTVLESCDPYVARDTTCKTTCPYQKTLLDWRRICGPFVPSTTVLKNYIQTYGPVTTVLYVGDGSDTTWQNTFASYDGSTTLYYPGAYAPNHCVCIVGWDDNLSHGGGSGGWIVKNSWGSSWWGGACGYGSEKGYFTIAYGSAQIGRWASYMNDWQDYDASGSVLYYDEGGWTAQWGYGGMTAWGMCKFVPGSACKLSRVEFWTTDITTDIDIYIYDTFSGGTLSNMLTSEVDTSFGEVGYHSVPMSSPPTVAAGNDVYVAVKFTNNSFAGVIATDNAGSTETNKTYMSADGNTWSEMGGSSNDVTIRLRTTAPTVAPAIDVVPDTLKFGQVQVSSDSSRALRVKNTGTDTLRVTDINASSSVLAVSDTAFKVAPADSHAVTVTFTPAAAQSYSETLTIQHNAKGSTVVPALGQGVSVGAPAISVSPDTLKFGQVRVGADSSQTLRIRSTGTDTLQVNDINLSSSVLAVSDTAFSLAPAESTDVTVTFTPAAVQSYSEMLTIVHNAKGTTIVPVVGSGVAGQDLSIATGDIEFDPAVPLMGDTVTIEARVHNVTPKGILVAVDSVVVRFYDGDPDVSGVQIGTDQTIPTIEPDSSETAQVMWDTQGQQGGHQIHVLVDPDDQILESSEGNNRAQKGITVHTMPVVQALILSDPSPTAAGVVDFAFTFDRKMDVAIEPAASYGTASPYTAHALTAAPGWSADSTSWTGRDTIVAAKGDGLNTLRIQGAQDPLGQAMEADTSWTFFIDTVEPASQAGSPAYSGATSFPVSWSGSDPAPGSGIASYSVWVLVDGLFPTEWFSDTTDTSAVYSGSSGHYYSFYSMAKDGAGNEEAAPGAPDCTTYVDTDPPAIPALLSPPDDFITGDDTPTLVWGQVFKALNEGEITGDARGRPKSAPMTYHLQVSLHQDCTDPGIDISGLADTSFSIPMPLATQAHYWRVQATDPAGNPSGFPVAAFKFTVDTDPPLIGGTTDWPDTGFGGPFAVESNIGDPAGVALALLWYRTDADTIWRADTMMVAGSLHQGTIAGQMAANTVVEYYVYAEDGAIPANSQTDPIGAPATYYSFTAAVTGIADELFFGGVPEEFVLYQNYPDPFNANTEILYALPRACHARLEIYNVLGQRVKVLADGPQAAGYHIVHWDGRDESGRAVASGLYLYRLHTPEYAYTRKMVLLR